MPPGWPRPSSTSSNRASRADDTAYLAGLKGNDGRPLFEPAFLDYLCRLEPACDIDAVPEGTVVFPQEPLVRVRGPLLQAQLLETALLNIINFQTLVATKAARLVLAARGEPVLEFGLRRAQGIDGALSASRAAYIGGCEATSNVLAGQLFDIPVRGTHAHSWVMCHDDELTAFREYARVMPNNCVFLVDTYDTLQGVRHAVTVGQELRRQGHELIGIRLDSGDLASLSIEARKILDEGGFPRAAIVASNDLDEQIIETLKQQGARISVWGVGTRLVTGYDDPALGGVYKLSAIRDARRAVAIQGQALRADGQGLHARRPASPPLATRTACPLADAIFDETMRRATAADDRRSAGHDATPDDTRGHGGRRPARARLSPRAEGLRLARLAVDPPPRGGATGRFSRRREAVRQSARVLRRLRARPARRKTQLIVQERRLDL